MDLVERLADCVEHMEELSRRIGRIKAGDVHHQVRFGDGPWEDSTQLVLDHYEQLLGTFKTLGEDIRRRIDAGEI
ncbi:hypothetical protein [Rhizobium sp. BK376]|uniref:hypothetical protein n=1 Tax=Rhizobium sp. BK376 TaxID=2512149 RepID=UPI00104E6D83|nr:hypothetical protein [Rhizobium sp. BK376]TCR90975.1 hypothetical protein EV561_103369 [Rhizobium sp. BK376]